MRFLCRKQVGGENGDGSGKRGGGSKKFKKRVKNLHKLVVSFLFCFSEGYYLLFGQNKINRER